jgi:hypothetical protein
MAQEIRIVESIIKRGTWKVWVKSSNGTGFLRGGFAWKTKTGAAQAARRYAEGA